MSASFYDLIKYAKLGIASPDMTMYDCLKASALFGGTRPDPPADSFVLNESKLDEGVIQ